jgi:hypothetical protein
MEPYPNNVTERVNPRIGTRFWIFPQPPFIPGYEEPDRVWLSILPDEIRDGPSDQWVYVVDPLIEKQPYSPDDLPPFEGERRPAARSGPDRNFDDMDPKSRAYLGVHVYACVHFVLDIWHSYLGHRIRWFFDPAFRRLEIIPLVDWDNAHAGYGYLELGASDVGGVLRPYALNFDTIAHEVGHFISLSELGIPMITSREADFFPFSEAFSDCVSLISLLHFDSAVDRLLRRTQGNLLLSNELNRFAETSPETQIRLATNFRRMSETTREPHDRSLPFLGAIFDSIVEIYHRQLVRDGFADRRLLNVDLRDLTLSEFDEFRLLTERSFRDRPLYFKLALETARDQVGSALAASLRTLDPNTMTLEQVARAVIQAASRGGADALEANFVWREIIGPR